MILLHTFWDRFADCRVLGLQGIPRAELLEYMGEVADALDELLKHHLQHTDIKPNNVCLKDGHAHVVVVEKAHCQLMDVPESGFVVAISDSMSEHGIYDLVIWMDQAVQEQRGNDHSLSGGATPVYAAPEVLDGKFGPYCDQYSLAIVYQEMLTGKRPFRGANIHELVMQHVQGKPDLSPLPEADRAVVGRALEKDPGARYPSCSDFVQALHAAS